jgi:hypothetical protein
MQERLKWRKILCDSSRHDYIVITYRYSLIKTRLSHSCPSYPATYCCQLFIANCKVPISQKSCRYVCDANIMEIPAKTFVLYGSIVICMYAPYLSGFDGKSRILNTHPSAKYSLRLYSPLSKNQRSYLV